MKIYLKQKKKNCNENESKKKFFKKMDKTFMYN